MSFGEKAGKVGAGILAGLAAIGTVAAAVAEAEVKEKLIAENVPKSLTWLHKNFGITEKEVYEFLRQKYYNNTLRG